MYSWNLLEFKASNQCLDKQNIYHCNCAVYSLCCQLSVFWLSQQWKWVQLWDGMLYSKLEHAVNVFMAPARNQQQLFVSAGLDLWRKVLSVAHHGDKLHQWRHLAWRCSSNRMWMISMKLERNSGGEYASKLFNEACAAADVWLPAHRQWSSSLCVIQSVIQLSPACPSAQRSPCVRRYANSWPV